MHGFLESSENQNFNVLRTTYESIEALRRLGYQWHRSGLPKVVARKNNVQKVKQSWHELSTEKLASIFLGPKWTPEQNLR
jgi:hypothetical protein